MSYSFIEIKKEPYDEPANHSENQKYRYGECNQYLDSNNSTRFIQDSHKRKFPCVHCNNSYLKANLGQHEKMCSSGRHKKFFCTFNNCKAFFVTHRSLRQHTNRLHSEVLYTFCPYENCGVTLKASSLQVHINGMHKNIKDRRQIMRNKLSQLHSKACLNGYASKVQKFRCSVDNCTSSFLLKEDLDYHKKKVHVDLIKCPHNTCFKYFKPCSLSKHLTTVHERRRVVCKKCKRDMSWRYISRHYKRCHRKVELCCSEENCQLTFYSEADLRLHAVQAHKLIKKEFPELTKTCAEVVQELEKHKELYSVSEEEKFTCEECEASFDTQKHMLVHFIIEHAN